MQGWTATRWATHTSRPTNCTRTRGKKGVEHDDPEDPLRRRANKRRGHGTFDNDRPPVAGVVGRASDQLRLEVIAIRRESEGDFAGKLARRLLREIPVETHAAEQDRHFRHVGMENPHRDGACIDVLRLAIALADARQSAIRSGLAHLGKGCGLQAAGFRLRRGETMIAV